MTQQPPAAPTLHPNRCETCKYFPAGSIFDERCPYTRYTWRHAGNHPQCIKDPWLASEIWQIPIDVMSELTSDVGCASHSSTPDADARQRIEDVVKELERRLAQSKRLRTYFTSEECARTDGYESGLESAIALLKDGVVR